MFGDVAVAGGRVWCVDDLISVAGLDLISFG